MNENEAGKEEILLLTVVSGTFDRVSNRPPSC